MPVRVIFLTLVIAAQFQSCCSTANKAKEEEQQQSQIRQPPFSTVNSMGPETASINAVVRNLRLFSKEDRLCDLEISNVLAYGQATPPIAEGSVILVIIPASLSGNNKIENNNSYHLTIQHIKLMKKQDIPEWKVIAIK